MNTTDTSGNTMIAVDKIRVGMAETMAFCVKIDLKTGLYTRIGTFDKTMIMEKPISMFVAPNKMWVLLSSHLDAGKYLVSMDVETGMVSGNFPVKGFEILAMMHDVNQNIVWAMVSIDSQI